MAACDPQLSQAEREAGYDQQRTGVGQALRPFSGTPSIENLLDYINRELVPCLRATRKAANDVWKQVVDNAPSANPLAFYFSTTTTAADPTAGRVRLNQATQNTATVIRVSESNGRLQSVQPWLDVMSGGPTSPLGTVTLLDAINPGRFLRFDLNTMTDQGAYWDLGVTFIEGSDVSPFVDDEAVTIGFIAGVSAAGSTVPVGSLSPVANDTFLGNVSGASAAPAAVNLSTLAGAGLAFGTHTLDVTGSTSITITSDQVQRAALTGDVTASLNSNATTIANSAVTNAKMANMAPGTVKGLQVDAAGAAAPVDLTGAEVGELLRFAFLSDSAGATGTTDDFALDVRVNTVRINPGSLGGDVTITGFALNGGGSTNNAGGRFVLVKQGSSNKVTLKHSTGSVGNNQLVLPGARDLDITTENTAVIISYWGGRWQILGSPFVVAGTGISLATNYTVSVDQTFAPTWTGAHTFSSTVSLGQKVLFAGTISPTALSADQNDYNPTGWSTANVVRLSTNSGTTRVLTGAQAGSSGELKWLVNLGPGFVQLDAGSTSSTSTNRWLHVSGTTLTLSVNGVCGILYDPTSARWRCIYPDIIT